MNKPTPGNGSSPPTRKRKRAKLWTYSAGKYGATVTVCERQPGGILYARALHPELREGRGGYRYVSLGHRDKKAAEAYANREAAKLLEGISELRQAKVTLARVFAAYKRYRTPQKSPGEQKQDERRIAMWTAVLGGTKDPHKITLYEWEQAIARRRSGEIDGHGREVATGKRIPVRARTVEVDFLWLRWVLNWATKWQNADGGYLMRESPVRGFDVPAEKNPRRPVASQDRYEKVRAVSDQVMMEIRWDGRHQLQRSYLSEILDLAHGTGRRISATCALRYRDLILEPTPATPHGAIRWPGETDKESREWHMPMSGKVRTTVDRIMHERPGIGAAYLFPSPVGADRPVDRNRAGEWLQEAERLAKVPKQKGGLWHPYRRGWATARKGLPVTDVAQAGGWRSTDTLLKCYQQADDATILRVVEHAAELREVTA
jgi:integrase